mmetsp:Transcript_170479/g.546730  ORF Transcript_170479/g.546730 Transcript_170479/m.546730 type:complete len:266 (+) Transcript_170479:2086-2883(+)
MPNCIMCCRASSRKPLEYMSLPHSSCARSCSSGGAWQKLVDGCSITIGTLCFLLNLMNSNSTCMASSIKFNSTNATRRGLSTVCRATNVGAVVAERAKIIGAIFCGAAELPSLQLDSHAMSDSTCNFKRCWYARVYDSRAADATVRVTWSMVSETWVFKDSGSFLCKASRDFPRLTWKSSQSSEPCSGIASASPRRSQLESCQAASQAVGRSFARSPSSSPAPWMSRRADSNRRMFWLQRTSPQTRSCRSSSPAGAPASDESCSS